MDHQTANLHCLPDIKILREDSNMCWRLLNTCMEQSYHNLLLFCLLTEKGDFFREIVKLFLEYLQVSH
ncbi:hypothetical protein Peur_041684 [Populus x canadensis]